MSSPVAEGGYQALFEPSGLTVKPLSLAPEARDMLLHEWLPSMCLWDQRVGRQLNKLCGNFPGSLAGQLQGQALTKRAKLKSQLAGRKASQCFVYFCGRVRVLRPRKSGTKCEQVARLSLWKGWSQQSHRQFQSSAGSAMPHIGYPSGRASGAGDTFLTLLPCQPRETHPGQLLQPVTATSFWIPVQAPALFHPQKQFDANVCKWSIYGFVLGMSQLARDSDAGTIIVSLTDILWRDVAVGIWDRLSQ